MPMPWHHPPPCLPDELYAWDPLQFPFFSTFLLSHHLDKDSYLSHSVHKHSSKSLLAHLCCCFANSNLGFVYFLVLVRGVHLLCTSVLLCQESPEDSEIVRASTQLCGVVADFTDMSLRVLFTAFMICLSSTTVVFSADQVVVGCCCRWWFPNSWFLHALCFC